MNFFYEIYNKSTMKVLDYDSRISVYVQDLPEDLKDLISIEITTYLKEEHCLGWYSTIRFLNEDILLGFKQRYLYTLNNKDEIVLNNDIYPLYSKIPSKQKYTEKQIILDVSVLTFKIMSDLISHIKK